jgi:hypothetical protein
MARGVPGRITRVNEALAVSGAGADESVASTAKLKVPVAVGVPVIVLEKTFIPGGSWPELNVQVSSPTPP